MIETEHIVQQRLDRRQGNTEYYELTTTHGQADVTFETVTGWLGISNVNVEAEYRRQGRAKALLGHVIVMAEEMDAMLIYASIISRESIDAFSAVFGPAAVQIQRQGSYGSIGGAEAFLSIRRY